jgi:very-short-patch-repair endonuclease
LDSIKNKIKNTNKSTYKLKITDKNIIDVDFDNKGYLYNCNICNDTFFINYSLLKNRKKTNTILCTICNPILKNISGLEIELKNFIKEKYISTTIFNDKNILKPYELDIYIPDLKIAFEFNGLFWHNENNKENDYHLNKTEECEKQGIQLIHIWEDDWLNKQEIIKSMILNKLGKTLHKIYARKCEIKEINDNKLIKEFLEKNHIQEFVGSKIKIGLLHNNELISLMTFGDRRVAMGKKLTKEGEYELLRFCNKLNTNVIGGASKLFKYFIINYKPEEITTYADRSISQGKLYETLGFKFQGKTQPNYYYIIDGVRKHRFNFRKDKLIKEGYDPNKTEHDIMLERKIYRIYDSGNLKFIYNNYV